MSLSLDGLRSFQVLSEELHFGRAAKRLAVTQSALTKQVRRLEDELGGRLFERNSGGVTMTPAGEALRDRARLLLADASALESFARRAVRGEVGRLRIGAGIATIRELVPRALIAFRKEHPNVAIELQDQGSKHTVDGVLSGALDVGFVRLPLSDPRLESTVVLRDELQLVVPTARFPRPVTLESMRDEPFVLIAASTSETFRAHALSLCRQAGFTANVVQDVKEVFTALNLVRAGLGVSLVPATARWMKVPGVRLHALKMPAARWSIGMIWRRDRKASVAAFLKAVQRVVVVSKPVT